MKILIVSDTHRKDENLKWVIRKTKPFDMLIHLGDAEGSEYEIMKWVDKGCDLEMIMGNNDFFSQLEREKEIMIGKYLSLIHIFTGNMKHLSTCCGLLPVLSGKRSRRPSGI